MRLTHLSLLLVVATLLAGCDASPVAGSNPSAGVGVSTTIFVASTATSTPPPLSAPATRFQPEELPQAEKDRLDKLDAGQLVKEFFSSGDPHVEYYLSAPLKQKWMLSGVPDTERAGGVDDLEVQQIAGQASQVYKKSDWPEQRHFRVTYTSRKTNSVGEAPGPRLLFVIVGRQSESQPWKVMEIGTGP